MYSFYLYVLIYTNSQRYFCIVADFVIGVISTGSEAKLSEWINECMDNLINLEIPYQLWEPHSITVLRLNVILSKLFQFLITSFLCQMFVRVPHL